MPIKQKTIYHKKTRLDTDRFILVFSIDTDIDDITSIKCNDTMYHAEAIASKIGLSCGKLDNLITGINPYYSPATFINVIKEVLQMVSNDFFAHGEDVKVTGVSGFDQTPHITIPRLKHHDDLLWYDQ